MGSLSHDNIKTFFAKVRDENPEPTNMYECYGAVKGALIKMGLFPTFQIKKGRNGVIHLHRKFTLGQSYHGFRMVCFNGFDAAKDPENTLPLCWSFSPPITMNSEAFSTSGFEVESVRDAFDGTMIYAFNTGGFWHLVTNGATSVFNSRYGRDQLHGRDLMNALFKKTDPNDESERDISNMFPESCDGKFWTIILPSTGVENIQRAPESVYIMDCFKQDGTPVPINETSNMLVFPNTGEPIPVCKNYENLEKGMDENKYGVFVKTTNGRGVVVLHNESNDFKRNYAGITSNDTISEIFQRYANTGDTEELREFCDAAGFAGDTDQIIADIKESINWMIFNLAQCFYSRLIVNSSNTYLGGTADLSPILRFHIKAIMRIYNMDREELFKLPVISCAHIEKELLANDDISERLYLEPVIDHFLTCHMTDIYKLARFTSTLENVPACFNIFK